MSNLRSNREPIPWVAHSSDNLATWEWRTDDLSIKIMSEGSGRIRMFHWKIYDTSNGKPSVFDEGPGTSFNDCVDQAIEIVSKSWPRSYGYAKYAGELAYTFKIGAGSLINFESLLGKEVTLTVKGNDGIPMSLIGPLDIKHYDITIAQGSQVITIPPSRILDIQSNYGRSLLEELKVERKS